MAILRGGKRIGPFDIRLGLPRDRSMENIDTDPRIFKPANSENTIGRFRAAMAKANGYARQARFAVRIFPPANLSKLGAFSEKFREKVKQSLNGVTARRYFWEDVLDGDIAEMVEKHDEKLDIIDK